LKSSTLGASITVPVIGLKTSKPGLNGMAATCAFAWYKNNVWIKKIKKVLFMKSWFKYLILN
jgi:hypothetical protein